MDSSGLTSQDSLNVHASPASLQIVVMALMFSTAFGCQDPGTNILYTKAINTPLEN